MSTNEPAPDTTIPFHRVKRALPAAWLGVLTVSLLLASFSPVSSQPSRIETGRLATAKKDSLGSKMDSLAAKLDSLTLRTNRLVRARKDTLSANRDTVAVQRDTTHLLTVTAAPDTLESRADTVLVDTLRAKEAHPQDSPTDRGFLIRTSDGKSELRIIGSVRLNGIYDFNGLQNASSFNTYDIPVGEANIHEGRFQMSVAQTRLALEATKKSGIGDVFFKVETDFLGASGTLRLRQAYGTLNEILIGQTWSTFDDLTSIPLTVDVDGPNSSVSLRTVQIRYMGTINPTLTWDAAIESPDVESSIPDSVGEEPAFQSFPDVIGRMRQTGTWGHVQLAGVLRSISVRDPAGNLDVLAGYGLLLSGRFYLGRSRPDRILYQFVGGRGISRYITALKGKGLDVVYNPSTAEVELTLSAGGYVSYARQWNPKFLSYLTAGFVRIRNIDFFPADAFNSSMYLSADTFYDSSVGVRLGLEYTWGRRENKNGDSGNANRVAFLLQYDF